MLFENDASIPLKFANWFRSKPGTRTTNELPLDRWVESTKAELSAVWTWWELLFADGTLEPERVNANLVPM